jgi:C-terminal processing protease CtpA/Prc
MVIEGVSALLSISNASAQESPAAKIRGENVQILTPEESDHWKERLAAGRIGTGLDISDFVKFVGDKGLTVGAVEEGSTAEDAGLKHGDVIVSIDGKPVVGRSDDDVSNAMHAGASGSKVTFGIVRGTATLNVTVTRDTDRALGMTYALDPVIYPIVSYVWDKSPAASAGLQKGDRLLQINDVEMKGFLPNVAEQILNHNGFLDATVKLKVERDGRIIDATVGRAILPGWNSVIDTKAGPGAGDALFQQFVTVKIAHLDWCIAGMKDILHFTFGTDGLGHYPAMIVDLRGTKGYSPEAAAFVAANLLSSGSVLRFYNDSTGTDYTYKVEGGKLYKTTAYSKDFIASVDHFEGKVAVLVDSDTDGVAVALAHTLQDVKRAIVVGTGTGSNAALRTFSETTAQNGRVIGALSTTAHLTNLDGQPLTAVVPDDVPVNSAAKDATMLLSGGTPGWDVEDVMTYVFWAAVAVAALVVIWSLFFRKYQPIEAPVEVPPPSSSENTAKDNAELPAATNTEDRFRIGVFGWSATSLLLAILAVCFLAPGFVNRVMFGPPIGGHAEVLVELFVDGSQSSEHEKAIIASLQSEMRGPIKFVTIDLREHPESTKKPTIRRSPSLSTVLRSFGSLRFTSTAQGTK